MSDIEKEKLNLRDIKAHNPKNKIRESAGYKVFTVFNTIIMILVSVATLYPFLYLISQSFTSTQAIIEGYTGLVPKGFNIETYKYILTRNDAITTQNGIHRLTRQLRMIILLTQMTQPDMLQPFRHVLSQNLTTILVR